MMNTPTRNAAFSLLVLASACSLAACDSVADSQEATAVAAATPPRTAAPKVQPAPAPPPRCADCGTITRIESMTAKGTGSGMGAVAGAVAGAVIGHQIGSGRGNDAATAAGAIGGGFAGHEIEKRMKGTTYFHVSVSMEDGSVRTVDVDTMNGLAVGSKVRVLGNNLQVAGA